MTDYKTMRVPEDAWQDAKDAKRDGETWGEYLQRCADVEGDATTNAGVSTSDVATAEDIKDLSVLVEQLGHRVERVEEALPDR
ncbi:hypothetical protein OSG_eHP27_00190 [environmental Halophage eHP-27]|nr:hypothetical protein OSG_eHP27_00190 [environmental Halophage eHP-27]